jgi:hypothetical protein
MLPKQGEGFNQQFPPFSGSCAWVAPGTSPGGRMWRQPRIPGGWEALVRKRAIAHSGKGSPQKAWVKPPQAASKPGACEVLVNS